MTNHAIAWYRARMPSVFDPLKVLGLPLSSSEQVAEYLRDQYDSYNASERKAASILKQDIYDNNYAHHVFKQLSDQFCWEAFENLQKMMDDSHNVLKRIIDRISIVYQEPASYELDDESSSANLDALHGMYDHNGIMRSVNRLLNVHGTLLLRPVVRNGKPDVDIITPCVAEVATAPVAPYDIQALLYALNSSSLRVEKPFEKSMSIDKPNFEYIDSDKMFMLTEDGKKIPHMGAEDMSNPYGFVPVVVARKERPINGDFWTPRHAYDLASGCIQIAILMTQINNAIKWGCFKQITCDAKPEDISKKQTLDPSTLLYGANFNTLDFQVDLKQMLDAVDYKVRQLCTAYGISFNEFQITSQPASGFARKIENASLINSVHDQQRCMERIERDLYKMQAQVYNKNGIDGLSELSPDAEMNVNFAEQNWGEESPKTQYDIDKQMQKDGLLSINDIYRKHVDSDVSDDAEVTRRLQEIKALNQKVKTFGLLSAGESATPEIGRIV